MFTLRLIIGKPAAAMVAPSALLVAVNKYRKVALGLLIIAFGQMAQDNVNNDNPTAYVKNNLEVSMTNICTEITLHTDEEHSFMTPL